MLKFLFLLGKTIELRLSHLNVIPLILAVIVVAFSRTKINLIDIVMFHITAILLDHNVSKVIKEVSKFETSGSTIASMDSRYLKSL
jgi:hypothetical protein